VRHCVLSTPATQLRRVDESDRLSRRWREVPPGHYVLGCLTERGAYAVCDTVVAMMEPKGA